MMWLIFIPMIHLCLATPIAAFRLLHRPRFPKACVGVIALSIVTAIYEAYLLLSPDGTILDLIVTWFWLIVSIPIQLVLLTLAFVPIKAQTEDLRKP